MSADPTALKHTTEDLGDRLLISMPSRKKLGFILVLALCNVAWLLLELLSIFLFPYVLSRESNLLFLVVWTSIGILLMYPLAWQLFGKERIQITNQFIEISKVVLGFKRSREYPANQINGLRLTQFDRYNPRDGINQGLITFSYDARMIDKYTTFAAGVDETEAKQIIAEIQQKYPQYKS